MLPKDLETYLKECKTKGLLFERVKEQLVAAGWKTEQIAAAEQWYQPKPEEELQVEEVSDEVIPSSDMTQPPSVKAIRVQGPIALVTVGGLLILAILIAGIASLLSPKPQVLISRVFSALQQEKTFFIDATLKTSSKNITSFLSSNEFIFSLKGTTDLSKLENPEGMYEASVGTDINASFIKKGTKLYYKISKVPFFVTMALGLKSDQVDKLLADWVATDINAFDLKKVDQSTLNMLKTLFASNSTLSSEGDTYILKTSFDKVTLEKIQKKLSDTLSKLELQTTIDKKKYVVKSIAVTAQVSFYPSESSVKSLLPENVCDSFFPTFEKENLKVTFTASFSDYGKTAKIQSPSKPILQNTFLQSVASALKKGDKNTIDPVLAGLNTLNSGLQTYFQKNQTYPESISQLVEKEILEKTFIQEAENNKIYYLTNNTQDKVFIYSLTKDSLNKKSPYRGISSIGENRLKVQNYSSKEINEIIGQFVIEMKE